MIARGIKYTSWCSEPRNNVWTFFSFLAIQETNAVHVNVGAGSYLEINIPMTVGENGELRLSLTCFPNVFPEQLLNSYVCERLVVFFLCDYEMYTLM